MTEASDASSLMANVLRTFPYTTYIATGSYAALTGSTDAATLFFALLGQEAFNYLAKKTCKIIFGKDNATMKRPPGAMDTGIYPQHQPKVSTTQGMPSGHSQTSWFICTIMIQSIVQSSRSTIGKLLSCLFAMTVASLVTISRTKHGGKLCVHVNGVQRAPHTVLQVIVGAGLGIVLGLVAYNYQPSSNSE